MEQRVLFALLFCCSTLAQAEDTVLKLYRPYGEATGQVMPIVKHTLAGHCLSQSRIIVREDAWRCEAGGRTFDPCFVKAGTNRKEALCPQSPWVGDSVQINVSLPLDNAQNETLDMSRTYPWGIELSNGERCLAVYSTEVYEEMPIRYRCTNENLLLGYLQRCKTTWSMLEKTPQGVVTSELKKAWF
jgi:hypothetical protein